MVTRARTVTVGTAEIELPPGAQHRLTRGGLLLYVLHNGRVRLYGANGAEITIPHNIRARIASEYFGGGIPNKASTL